MTSYRFVLSSFAREVTPPPLPVQPDAGSAPTARSVDAPAPGAPSPAAATAETEVPLADLADAEAMAEALTALTQAAALTLDDLYSCALLPESARTEQLERLRSKLSVALAAPLDREANHRAFNAGLSFRTVFDERGTQIAQALAVLARARADAGVTEPEPLVLERVTRYFGDPGTLAELVPADAQWASMTGDPESIATFARRYEKWKSALVPDPAQGSVDPAVLWQAWRPRIENYMCSRAAGPPDPELYADVVAAAALRLPSRLFRLPLSRMDRLDWSDAALEGLPREDGPPATPRWLLFAALAALGFSTRFLHRLEEADRARNGPLDEADAHCVSILLGLHQDAPPALLEVYADRPRPKALAEIDRGQPLLSVGKSVAEDYVHGLRWLQELNAFGGAMYEHEG